MSGVVQIIIGGLLQGGVFAIVALGFSLVYRVTNVVNLAQGAFCVLGAMGMYYFEVVFGWPILPAAAAAVACATAFGLLIGALTFVPAVARLPASSALVLTAGLLTFLVSVTLVCGAISPTRCRRSPARRRSSSAPAGADLRVVARRRRVRVIAGLWLLLPRRRSAARCAPAPRTRWRHG